MPRLSWLYKSYSGLYWPATGCYSGDVITVPCCQTLLGSFLHFKMVKRERTKEEQGDKRRPRKKEAVGGLAERGRPIYIQAHALVAPLGPFITGGFCALTHCHLSV